MDTSFEKTTRKTLQMETSDFTEIPSGDPDIKWVSMSERIRLTAPLSEMTAVVSQAVNRVDPNAGTPQESATQYQDPNGEIVSVLNWFFPMSYDISVQDGYLLSINRQPERKVDDQTFAAVVEAMKQALTDIAFKNMRKAFVEKKMARLVGEKKGLDPLMVKNYLAPKVGSRRRKSKKAKKTRRV